MRTAGFNVERHDDHFPDPRTPDEIWLPAVAAKGWIALSHDKRIRRVKAQRDLAMRGGLALFFLIGKNHRDLERNLVATMPAIIRFRERNQPPFIAKVHRPPAKFPIGSRAGAIEMFLTKEAWLQLVAAEEKQQK